ncbi:PH domain-containing protein [uncultured Rothia sp.]|uniref:PH domain-containing protein n=1 Tax=uncultured Rothia sp. TaxID=316088 RepID=UPI0028E84B11|nr:PH domain-containing protein [uncultured Rothia sp.]
MSIAAIMTWTLQAEIPVPQDAQALLGPGENAVAAFATFRDSAIFTTHRLIIRDAQGLTGKKVEMYSLPYSSIHMWSSENAGNLFDANSEIALWTKVGYIKIKLGRKIDVRKLDRLIAQQVLNAQQH